MGEKNIELLPPASHIDPVTSVVLGLQSECGFQSGLTVVLTIKRAGLAARSECRLPHLGVAGLSPSPDNLGKPLGEYAALASSCMINGTKTEKRL